VAWWLFTAHRNIQDGLKFAPAVVETTFRQQVVKAMKALDPKYADWQVPVTYRAGATSRSLKAH
jgi:hypothetical protein